MDLPADGGLSEAEFFAGFGDRPVFGDGPEIKEVMIVQPIHIAPIACERGGTIPSD